MKKLFLMTVFALVLGIAQMSFGAQMVDVPSGHWAEDAVKKLVDAGLIVGYPDNEFKGNRQLTRYEYAMVIERLVNLLNTTYCTKSECKVTPSGPGAKEVTIDNAKVDEIKDIVKKLAAEFKDEIAALKVKVDENSAKIAQLEQDVKTSRIGNITVNGSIRQRIDVPNTDLQNNQFVSGYYNLLYEPALGASAQGLNAGYELLPSLVFSGQAGDNVTFSIGLDKSISSDSLGYVATPIGEGELVINHAYADLDFSETVRELDVLKVRSGYQTYALGPYGLLVDNSGLASNPAIKLDVAKDIVSVTGIAGLAGITGTVGAAAQGLGATGKDPYTAMRLGLDLPWLDLGVNYLASGVDLEKGWGADLVAPLLKDSTFLKEVRAEYMTVTDETDGTPVAANADDNSFVVGLDVYKSKRSSFTLSYGDIPAAVTLSSLDGSPFTEYDMSCPAGLDVKPLNGVCRSYENERTLFPAGFEGIGINASLIVLGDVEIAARGLLGNFAGDYLATGGASPLGMRDGDDYPGFGALSVSKPINDKSTFRVEYSQQGKDPILLNRVRGELLITF